MRRFALLCSLSCARSFHSPSTLRQRSLTTTHGRRLRTVFANENEMEPDGGWGVDNLMDMMDDAVASTDGDDNVKVTVKIKKPPPKEIGSPTTLAIEAAFVQAASGMSGANYEFGLLEFIRATRDAYDEGIMVPALNLELSMCQQYTAGRPLQPDEIELRTVWLSLVYLTFERVGYESKSAGAFPGQSVAEDLRQKFYTFTYDIVNAKKQGYDLAGLKLEELLQSSEERTPMEQAVLSQAMRICYLAIQAAEEV